MKYWIQTNSDKLIVASGFNDAPIGSIWETDTHKYTINDCYPEGTPFQMLIWNEIARIPKGQTKTYGELVKLVGRGSPQAAGTACGKNKIPVIIPCHRVVGLKNKLAYAYGPEIKRSLLAEEGIEI